MVPIEHLGKALAILREKTGKTQLQIGEAANVTPSMISKWERNKEKPTLESLWKTLSAMGCTWIDLEAALRFVRGDAFPLQSRYWKINIESEEYPGLMPAGSEIAEPTVDLSSIFPDARPVPPEKEEAFLAMMRILLRML